MPNKEKGKLSAINQKRKYKKKKNKNLSIKFHQNLISWQLQINIQFFFLSFFLQYLHFVSFLSFEFCCMKRKEKSLATRFNENNFCVICNVSLMTFFFRNSSFLFLFFFFVFFFVNRLEINCKMFFVLFLTIQNVTKRKKNKKREIVEILKKINRV